jgi:phosphotransferase system enzyme I (PtsP)
MAKSESQRLLILADIGRIVSHSHDLQATLDSIVALVAERMDAQVCSIYLLDDGQPSCLTLRATVGLDPNAVGKVRMLTSEGLTGLVVEQMKPVAVREAVQHPRFKVFPETHEERFPSYLGVPLVERRTPIGVLAIRTEQPRDFSRDDVRMLETIGSQVTGLITTSRMLSLLEDRAKSYESLEDALARYEERPKEQAEAIKEERKKPKTLRGLPASPGFGLALVHIHQHDFHLGSGYAEFAEDTEAEKRRLNEAFEKSIEEVSDLKGRVSSLLSEEDSAIFHGHLLMLEDKGFRQKITDIIEEGRRAEFAVEVVTQIYKDQLSKLDDVYLKERVLDIEDIEGRLMRSLLGLEREQREFGEEFIVVADDIRPSELFYLDSPRLMGIVLARGGVTSHVAILAKSMDLPVVVGVTDVLSHVAPNEFMIVDGNSGAVYINPAQHVIDEYVRLEAAYQTLVEELKDMRELPTETLDGKHVVLDSNVGMISEIPLALENGAEGIGLYRTEFAFLSRPHMPTEDEQYELFRLAQEALRGAHLTVRTLDIGGEKTPSYFPMPHEPNPLLGWRSMRLSLDKMEIFETQLRAIVRAAGHAPLRIMFPMVSGPDELRAAKAALQKVIRDLGTEPKIEVGVMIEMPSAVALADRLARESDFFSIGTNDLVQYVLAVDRNNPKVSHRYQGFHPAVIAALYQTFQGGHQAGIPVGVCGEMAGAPASAILLAGMGADSLSMAPNAIPFVKRALRSVDSRKAAELVQEVLPLATTDEVEQHLNQRFRDWGILDVIRIPSAQNP